MQRFWDSYTHRVGLKGIDRVLAQNRLVSNAAARLIQSAVQAEQQHAHLSTTSVLRLQVAQNMLRHPSQAAGTLMGLSG
jgi:hypothetical protein